jgi:hypothetical protein
MEHRSSLRFGFRILTGSIFILKKFKNGVVLVKKKKVNELQPGFWPGFTGSAGSWFFYFFINPIRFQPRNGRVPDQPDPGSGRVSKICRPISLLHPWLVFVKKLLHGTGTGSRLLNVFSSVTKMIFLLDLIWC